MSGAQRALQRFPERSTDMAQNGEAPDRKRVGRRGAELLRKHLPQGNMAHSAGFDPTT